MFFGIGAVVVLVCVFGAYASHGGSLAVLWQPAELIIIFGAAIGAFVIANPKSVLLGTISGLKAMVAGSPYSKASYLELLSLLYIIFKLAKSKGMLALEAHVENPHESTIFNQFPKIQHNHHAMEFLCDYLRMMTLGTDNASEIEDLMNEELDTHHHELEQIPTAVQGMADGMPALGIVAAVLGVIHTMGSLTEPPEVLGHLIGAALVGTFMGVLLSYGFIAPMASSIKAVYDSESKYFQCIKIGLLAHLNGYAPQVSIEFARKSIFSDIRPTFYEVEETVSAIPNPA
ncbi:Flagellar motor stator protein MotA [Candidatus Bealeia paramacronuclearis]|uniref:Flagellar motor stator protein MotA n=1 Tax=Candidatus Bealeia paramacronuclearis TaxID=1921001 RepID=A0ABZ2C3X5_9PROT|nr:Flagellar motor stator protein MotA [Candidatus Bealeia paramacronuclearis]